MTCSICSAGSLPMARPRRPVAGRLVALLALVGLLAAAVPGVALGRDGGGLAAPEIHLGAVPPDQRCAESTPDPATGLRPCDPRPASAGLLLPVIGGVVAAGILALLATYLVLRRRASVPIAPLDPGEWWTCPKCGSTNVIGSPRCYSCGTWQR